MEWEIETDAAVNLYFTGPWPGADVPILLAAGAKKNFLSVHRGISKVEAQAVSTTATVIISPSIL